MEHTRTPSEFVLCFDGTGNQFHGDSSDSNVLKIFRMLDRNSSNQYHYYQPGIGTYVTSTSLSSKGRIQKLKSAYAKAKAAAVGSTFADHVMAGYKFLMRYYRPGDQLYFFGFSRGAYVARFLAEMLDKVGLLEMGNEELISFVWKLFAKWQQRAANHTKSEKREKKRLEQHMEDFKDTFCHPVSQIRFLGLFDTVNSVPSFENAWMRRSSKFPYTARTTAKVIRHAVSIDEHRAKFRQDLLSEVKPSRKRDRSGWRGRVKAHFTGEAGLDYHWEKGPGASSRQSGKVSVSDDPPDDGGGVDTKQDIDEVWFPGCHADIGGGWEIKSGESSLSYIPLLWMVHNAQQAGLRLDPKTLAHFDCVTVDQAAKLQSESTSEGPRDPNNSPAGQGKNPAGSGLEQSPVSCIQDALATSSANGKIHDCLQFGNGPSWASVVSWKVMEYLPFRRMDLRDDGTWKPIRWPLPRGEVRDMPDDAKVHVSAIRRLHENPEYRPGNLIIGGGGRGKLKASKEQGTGDWVVAEHEGCPLQGTFVRRSRPRELNGNHGD
ncbi:hypothetical protein BJY01DRAFT_235827 [Aspergillus pseudoustus]|uniref:T6SS Phospholipase effector Tle1-like catalytic domain-containing protein n=1 Tax=Aspergillus pseudoustus TaxID=1810923 RepID=A0ABR4JST4_9EURO